MFKQVTWLGNLLETFGDIDNSGLARRVESGLHMHHMDFKDL